MGTTKRNELDSFDEQGFLIRNLSYFDTLKGTQLPEQYQNILIRPGRAPANPSLSSRGRYQDIEEKAGTHYEEMKFLADLQGGTKAHKRFNLMDRLPKEIITSLNPYVRVYKVLYESENSDEPILAQLPFNNMKSYRVTDSQHQGTAPGQLAVGLKGFDFDYLGNHPGEVDTFIDCKLKLYFSSVDGLFKQYTHKHKKKDYKYSFLDLIKRPKKYHTPGKEGEKTYNSDFFRIRVDVGYVDPDEEVIDQAVKGMGAAVTSPASYKKKLIAEIQKAKISFFLNLQRHVVTPQFDVPSGGFDMELTFNASVENALSSKGADVLISGMSKSDAEALRDSNPYKEYEKARGVVDSVFGAGKARILDSYQFSDFFSRPGGGPGADPDLQWMRVAIGRATESVAILGKTISNLSFTWGDASSASVTARNLFKGPNGFAEYAAWHPDIAYQEAGSGIIPDEMKAVARYFVRRAALEQWKRQKGFSDNQQRVFAYNRIIRDLLHPARLFNYTGHAAYPVKVYRASLPMSVIREYNEKITAKSYTEKEKRSVQHEEAGGNFKTRADEARKAREARQTETLKFMKALETGQSLSATSTVGDSLNEDLTKYYKSVEKAVKARNTNAAAEKAKTPPFAIARPKLKDNDPNGKVDLRWVYFGDLIDTAINVTKAEYDRLNLTMKLNLWTVEGDENAGLETPHQLYTQRAAGAKNKNDAKSAASESLKDKFFLVLGSYEFTPPSGKPEMFNLARFPIPLRSFISFWNKKVVEPQRDSYSLRSFIRDVYVELVLNPLNSTSRVQAPEEAYSAHYEVMSLSPNHTRKLEVIHSAIAGPTENAFYARASKGPNKKVGTQDILYLGLTKKNQYSLFANNRKEDVKRGVIYLNLKQEGSPVLNIKFKRADQPYLMEARAEKGLLNRVTQLSEVYNCDFTTVGNMMIKPGKMIYISDPHFGDINTFFTKAKRQTVTADLVYDKAHASVLLGIGGYYLVTKAHHSVAAEGSRLRWKTSATCFWNSFGTSLEQIVKEQSSNQ